MRELIRESELAEFERDYADGLTSHQLVELFRGRGVRFSEATLRKYVQLGLLPRSRRVGVKGKHRGSQGVYPVAVVRRINTIKQLMEENHTIEEVREVLALRIEMGGVRDELESALGRLEARLQRSTLATVRRKLLAREVLEVRRVVGDLVHRIEVLDREIRPSVRRSVVAVPPAPPRGPVANGVKDES